MDFLCDYFCSFEDPEITASEIRGVHYKYGFYGLIIGKWFYFELGGVVFPFAFIFENLARTLSPATLGHHRLCCCLCRCAAAAVVLLWCCCAAAVLVLMVLVLLLLSRLCEDEALSRTQQARCAVVCVFVIPCCG